MTTETPPSSGPQDSRRRPGPTIDLEATDVSGGEPVVKASETVPPKPEAAARSWGPVRAIGAGVAAAVLILLGAMLPGLFTSREPGTAAFETRLARIEQQVRDLLARPPVNTVDPKAVEELSGRVAKLETAVAAVGTRAPPTDPAVLNRIATVEGALKAIDEKIGVVARRTDEIAANSAETRQRADATAAALTELTRKVAQLGAGGDLAAITARVTATERAIKALEAELAKRSGIGAGDHPARLALAGAALNSAVERGDGYVAELKAAKALAPDPRLLTPLDAFAATGLPSAAMLGRELMALMPALTEAAGGQAREASFLARLQANAEQLVRVRPLEAAPGDDPAAVLTRVALRASQSDPAGALAELAKLPADARKPAEAWIARAQARGEALASGRRFAADSFAALATP